MADRSALGMIGLLLVAATVFVMAMGGVVVSEHLNGRLHVDDGFAAVLPAAAR